MFGATRNLLLVRLLASRAGALGPLPGDRPRYRRAPMSTLQEYAQARELTLNLTLRELRGKYKRSVLGWTWSLLNPLSTMVIFSVIFAVFLKVQPPTGDPSGLHSFALFLLCGLLPWNFFSIGTTASMGSLIANSNLIKKVYFPREILVASTVAAVLVAFFVEMGVLAVVLLFFGNMVLPWIPVVILIMLIEAMFVAGIGLTLSVVDVYFRDTEHFMNIALQALFYSAPIVYPISYVPKTADLLGMTIPLRAIYELNPLVTFVESFRSVLYDLAFPPIGDLAYLTAWAVVLLGFGLWVFGKLERRLAEEL
jgi:lipopolysaccharide transport system permease protein